jgi:TolA-binding protein
MGAFRFRVVLVAASLAAACAAVAPASAASLADLRAQAQSAGLSPGSGGAGEQAAIDRMGRIALQFLDAADASDAGAVSTYEAIAGPLERSYEYHRQALDRANQSVIDADGDMDAMAESPAYKEHQSLAAQALYYLNWLRYRGALFYGGAKRKELLDKAAAGFGEFATAQSDNPIVAESRLGRGLAYLETDHVDWAINDFEAVAQMKGASPERIRKAQLALAESYVRVGRSSDALRASKAALDGATPGDQPRAQYTRARALLMAAASSPGQKATYQGEASSLLAQLQSQGGPWGTRAAQMVRNGLDNPKNWAGPKAKDVPPPPSEWDTTKQLVATGKFKEAIPKLEQVLASTDDELKKNHAEARYLLGLSKYRTGDLPGAIAVFDQILAEKSGSYRDDAGYLRFKASESRYAADPSAANEPAYEQAVIGFLKEFPRHKAAPEARFRLGELRQRQEKFAEAEAEYAQVKGDPSFEVRATFATAQCLVKRLEQTPEGTKPDPELMRRARAALDAFWAQTKDKDPKSFGDAPVHDFSGQAALMSAYLAALSDQPEYEKALAWLDGFEEKYPKLASERPQVVKLRLLALSRLGNLTQAAVEAVRPAVATLDPTYLDDLATRFLTTAARQQAAGKMAEAEAGKTAALLLSERALGGTTASTLSPVVRRRLQSTAASLHEERGEDDKALALYRAVLQDAPDVVSARAGVARLLEKQGKVADARALWDEIVAGPPGKQGWLEAHYQSARLSVALGDQARACTVLRKVPAEMVVNANADTPKKIADMLRACPAP